jgi:hypothetical protein
MAPVVTMFTRTGNIDKLVNLTVVGVSAMLVNLPSHLNWPDNAFVVLPPGMERPEYSDVMVTGARAQASSGFPLLYEQAVTSLWDSLDSGAIDFLTAWLSNAPDRFQNRDLLRVQVSLAEYFEYGQTDMLAIAASRMMQDRRLAHMSGIERFEAIVEAVGIRGLIDADTRRTLIELQQVRNVLVHRSGIADDRFTRVCPWMDVTPGQRLSVGENEYGMYAASVSSFVMNLMLRSNDLF